MTEETDINRETLLCVVGKSLGQAIVGAEYQALRLQGGDVGNVQLISGMAETVRGEFLPYRVVLKIQKKWLRPCDADSWRREYDLYASDLGAHFSASLRWPECYYAETSGTKMHLWLEYIAGVSGNDLSIDMLEQAATELGRLQGRLAVQQPAALNGITNLSRVEFMYDDYKLWQGTVTYYYLRSESCAIPEHLKQMLMGLDEASEEIFAKIQKLPIVLCHRDFWLENILYAGENIVLIDWDTSGWGYLGEDIASLIADDTDAENFGEYYRRFVPAYYRGAAEYMDISEVDENCIVEMMLIKYGYRLVNRLMRAKTPERKALQITALQKIYELS